MADHDTHTRAKYAETLSKHPEIEQHFSTYEDWVEFMVLSDEQMASKDDPEAVVDIDNIHQFAAMVAHWHTNLLARLKQLRDIPHGTQVGMTDENGKESKVKLKGDGMIGFQCALNACIAEVEQIPFTFTEEAPAANDAAPSSN